MDTSETLKGAAALMNYDDDPRGELPEGRQSSSKEIELLKSRCSY